MSEHEGFMRRAIALSRDMMQQNRGGPFGALVVKDGQVIAEGHNRVTSTNDPTAHAEVVAIREACQKLNSFSLEGCEIYTTCEPCPMCLSAIYWARIDRIHYGNARDDAAAIGFDDEFLYREMTVELHERSVPLNRVLHEEAWQVFVEWRDKPDKIMY